MPDHDVPTFVSEIPSGSNQATENGGPGALPCPASSVVEYAGPLPGRIGCYRIVRLPGEGGMGTVYEADQDFPHRTAALKLIRT